jgi:hypothetical protein
VAHAVCGRHWLALVGHLFAGLLRVRLAARALTLARKICGGRLPHVTGDRLRRGSRGSPDQPFASPVLLGGRSPASGLGHPFHRAADDNAAVPVAAVIASTKTRLMTIPPQLAIIIEHHSRRSVLRLQGELDPANQDCLRRAIRTVLDHHSPQISGAADNTLGSVRVRTEQNEARSQVPCRCTPIA